MKNCGFYLTISFNWAFDYWDNSASAEDTFLSFVRQDAKPAKRISLFDLSTQGEVWYDPDAGLAHGFFSDTLDISSYTTDDARLIFRLVEESDNWCLTGTASVAGIDNISITAASFAPAPVPEPATMLLLGIGLLGIAGVSKNKFKKG